MRQSKLLIIIFILLITAPAYSFEGYDKFPMQGNCIFPLTDVDVKLSEISVLMKRTSGRGRATKVTTEYMLENLGSKEISFKVAFPVESNCLGCTQMPDDFEVSVCNRAIQTSTSKIMSEDFYPRIRKAQGLKNTEGQKKKKDYEIDLITWAVSFNPKEKKKITTTYTMEWLLDPGSEYLAFNLGVLYLWKGNIDKAYFRLLLPQEFMDNIKAQDPSIMPQISIRPKKYKIKDNVLVWFFKDFKKEKISYISVYVDYIRPINREALQEEFEGEIVYDKAYGGSHIFKINGLSPGKEIQLTERESEHSGNNIEPEWSPDGKYIAYVNRAWRPIEKSNIFNIFIMEPDGKNQRKITNFSYGIIFNVRWDKTGNEILFTYNPSRVGEHIGEKAVNIRTGDVRDVDTSAEKIKGYVKIIPSGNEQVIICDKWLGPGEERFIVFQREGRPETTTEEVKGEIRKFLYKYKDNPDVILYKGNFYRKKKELNLQNASNPIWSRDNMKFVVFMREDLTIFDKNGNEIHRIKNPFPDEGAICLRMWSDDSKKLLFSSYCAAEGVQERIYILNLETKKFFFIAEGQNPDWYFGR